VPLYLLNAFKYFIGF